MDLLNKLLASGKKPDLVRLSGIYKFFTRRYEGLELAWFLDVRHALDEYITMADSIGDRELISDYRERLDGLARRWKRTRPSRRQKTPWSSASR